MHNNAGMHVGPRYSAGRHRAGIAPGMGTRAMNHTAPGTPGIVTAALLVIGDEILSGRTKDKNIGYIAEYLTNIGVDLREVRVVPDVEEEIVVAVNALRARHTYLFTTGGIGPTHDDITPHCVAKAVGVSIDYDPPAGALLKGRARPQGPPVEQAPHA